MKEDASHMAPANHNGTSAQTHFANILLAAFTMRLRTGKNQYYGNHNGSSAQTQCAHILAAAITMRFAAYHNHCFANHNGSNAQNRRGPSGDNARRSPFWRLWVLRLPLQRAREPSGDNARRSHFWRLWVLRLPLQRARGAQRGQRAPQPLLEALSTAPATAERAGGPAATTRAAAPSGGSGYCACHCRERGGPSGDNARRSPFWRLWVLRLPLQREGGPAATTRAAAPFGGSGYCACHCKERGGPSGDNARRSPSGDSRYCACHCRERGGPSGDNARRSPFWRLWVLRLPLQRARGAQRRQRAPHPLLEALGTAPATAESEGGPAATTRAAAPSGGSGYCACHCRERGGPSGDNARRSPFWRLWVLRLPLQRERGAQRRQRAPQPLLEALGPAPATAEREGGPAATTRAAAPSGGSGYCACHCSE